MKFASDQMKQKLSAQLAEGGRLVILDQSGTENRPGTALQNWAAQAQPASAKYSFKAAAKAPARKPAPAQPNKFMGILNSMS